MRDKMLHVGQTVWYRHGNLRMRIKAIAGSKLWLRDQHGREFIWESDLVVDECLNEMVLEVS